MTAKTAANEKSAMAKSSAAPAQLNFRNLRRELIDEIAAMSDDTTLHPENFHEQAGQLIADYGKTYAKAAHQALYEALSAAELVAKFEKAGNAATRIELLESIGDYESGWDTPENVLEMLQARANKLRRLALADAAKEQANGESE